MALPCPSLGSPNQLQPLPTKEKLQLHQHFFFCLGSKLVINGNFRVESLMDEDDDEYGVLLGKSQIINTPQQRTVCS